METLLPERVHFFEIHDTNYCPEFLRNDLTDYLAFIWYVSDMEKFSVEPLASVLHLPSLQPRLSLSLSLPLVQSGHISKVLKIPRFFSGAYRGVLPLLDRVLRVTGHNTLVDLCSGGGGYPTP
jgi:hypothetical protein